MKLLFFLLFQSVALIPMFNYQEKNTSAYETIQSTRATQEFFLDLIKSQDHDVPCDFTARDTFWGLDDVFFFMIRGIVQNINFLSVASVDEAVIQIARLGCISKKFYKSYQWFLSYMSKDQSDQVSTRIKIMRYILMVSCGFERHQVWGVFVNGGFVCVVKLYYEIISLNAQKLQVAQKLFNDLAFVNNKRLIDLFLEKIKTIFLCMQQDYDEYYSYWNVFKYAILSGSEVIVQGFIHLLFLCHVDVQKLLMRADEYEQKLLFYAVRNNVVGVVRVLIQVLQHVYSNNQDRLRQELLQQKIVIEVRRKRNVEIAELLGIDLG